MRDLTSQSPPKNVLVTTPVHPIVASDGRPPKKKRKKKKKIASLEVMGVYENNGTATSESKRWYFSLFLKLFGR